MITTDPFAGSPLEGVAVGATLTDVQRDTLRNIFDELLRAIGTRRRHIFLIHDSLQSTIGIFLQLVGMEVAYEVPFTTAGFNSDRTIFDIVARRDGQISIIEVKDEVKTRDMGQIAGYMEALKLVGTEAEVFLGTDILNYGHINSGMVGNMVRDMYQRGGFGVAFADKHLLVVCGTLGQLNLTEMPLVLFSTEPVG